MGKRRGNNEGSIYQRKDGLWAGQIQIGFNPKGTRKFVTYYGSTRRDLAIKIQNSLSDINRETFVEPSKILFEDWLWEWMKTFKQNTVSDSTYARYVSLINCHILPDLGRMKLQDIKNIHIQRLYNKLAEDRLSGSAIKHIHTVFRQSFEQAIKPRICS